MGEGGLFVRPGFLVARHEGCLLPVRPSGNSNDGSAPALVMDDYMLPFDQDAEEWQQLQQQDAEPEEQHLVEEGEEVASPGERLVQGDAGVDLAGPEEGRRPVTLRAPNRVTQAERDEHCLTHIPYRQWCPICVRARGRGTPHTSRSEEQKKGRGSPKSRLTTSSCQLEESQPRRVPCSSWWTRAPGNATRV